MSKAWLFIVLAAVTTSGVAGASNQTHLVIRVVSKTTFARFTRHPPTGPKNDVFVTRDVLLNDKAGQFGKAVGAVVGSDAGTYVFQSQTRFDLRGITRLPGGTLIIGGTVNSHQPVPVVGGTGRYAGAKGTLTIGASSGVAVLNVYSITVP